MKAQVIKKMVMNKHINITPIFKSDEGNCFVKCLQEIYYYNNIAVNVSDILAICDCFLLRYNYDNKGKVSIYINYENLDMLPLKMKKEKFDNVEEGISKVKDEIVNGRPVMLIVNTFYVNYTDDYLKKSGGFFGGGHALIITGFDDERNRFSVCDPTFNKEKAYISYKEIRLAWTYNKEAGTFKPLTMFSFKKKNGESFNRNIIKRTLEKDLKEYLVNMNNGNESMSKWLNDFKEAIELGINDKSKKIFQNIVYSMFHEIRWSRKNIGLVIKRFKTEKKDDIDFYSKKFEDYFTKWSKIHNLTYLGVVTNDIERIKKSYKKTILLIEEEIKYIGYMLENIFF